MLAMQTLLTSADAARRLGVKPGTVRLWERLGLLPATRTLSGTRIFTTGDVEQLVLKRAAARAKAIR